MAGEYVNEPNTQIGAGGDRYPTGTAPQVGNFPVDGYVLTWDDNLYAPGQGGAAWEANTGASGSASILVSDETQVANRTQDFGNFDQTWNNLGTLNSSSATTIFAGGTTNLSEMRLNNALARMTHNGAGLIAGLMGLTSVESRFSFTDAANTSATILITPGLVSTATQLHLQTAAVDVGTASPGEVLTLLDAATGEVEFQAAGGGGGSILTSDETQLANRTQDFSGFDQIWNNMGTWTVSSNLGSTFQFQSEDSGEFTTLSIDGTAGAQSLRMLVDDTNALADIRARLSGGDPIVEMYATNAAGLRTGFEASVSGLSGEPEVFVRTNDVDQTIASNGQVLTLVDATTGESEWATAPAGANIITDDLTQTANRTQDLAGFAQTWNNVNGFNVLGTGTVSFLNTTGSNQTQMQMNAGATLAELVYNNTGNSEINRIRVANGLVRMAHVDASGDESRIDILSGVVTGQPQIHLHTNAVDAASAVTGQVLTLIDGATGESEWATDISNIIGSDLTQTANRTQDFAAFQQNWNNMGDWTVLGAPNGDFTFTTDGLGAATHQLFISSGSGSSHLRYEDGAENSFVRVGVDRATLDVVDSNGDTSRIGHTLNNVGIEVSRSGGIGAHRLVFDMTGADPELRVATTAVIGATASNGDVLVLQDAATGEAEWQTFSGSNIISADLTQTANRTQDMNNFSQTWTDVGGMGITMSATNSFVVNAPSGTGEFSRILVDQTQSVFEHDDGTGVLHQFILQPTFAQIRADDGAGALYVVGANTTGNDAVGLSAQKSGGAGVVSAAFVDLGGADPVLTINENAILAGTAIDGDVLTLMDAATGRTEWAAKAFNGYTEVADTAALLALQGTLGASDVGHVAYQTDNFGFYIFSGGFFLGAPSTTILAANAAAEASQIATLADVPGEYGRLLYRIDTAQLKFYNGSVNGFEPLAGGDYRNNARATSLTTAAVLGAAQTLQLGAASSQAWATINTGTDDIDFEPGIYSVEYDYTIPYTGPNPGLADFTITTGLGLARFKPVTVQQVMTSGSIIGRVTMNILIETATTVQFSIAGNNLGTIATGDLTISKVG